MPKSPQLLLGILFGLLAGALWGLVFLAPALVEDFTPFQLTAGRYLLYGAFSFVLIISRWAKLKGVIGLKEWRALFWLSILGNPLYYVFLATAVQWAGVAAASLIMGLLPIILAFVGSRQNPTVSFKRLLPFLLIALVGVGLIAYQSFENSDNGAQLSKQLAGILLAFGALATWSLYAICNTRYLNKLPTVNAYDWSLLTGIMTGAISLALTIPAFFVTSTLHTSNDWLRFWGISASLAVIASIFGNDAWNRASRLLPMTLLGQMVIFETLFALLYGFLWEQRLPTFLEWLAIGLLLISVIGCISTHQSASPRKPTPRL